MTYASSLVTRTYISLVYIKYSFNCNETSPVYIIKPLYLGHYTCLYWNSVLLPNILFPRVFYCRGFTIMKLYHNYHIVHDISHIFYVHVLVAPPDAHTKQAITHNIKSRFTTHNRANGLALVVGTSNSAPQQMIEDYASICSVFENDLKLAVVSKRNLSCEQIVGLIKAAAELRY